MSDDLRTLLSLNPSLRVFTVHGRSDLVTPYGVSRYLLDRLAPAGTPTACRSAPIAAGTCSISMPAERRAFTDDARAFYGRKVTLKRLTRRLEDIAAHSIVLRIRSRSSFANGFCRMRWPR